MMKSLISYFECDGAATPGSVMGMGNPMAPDGTNVGSGDMFPTRRRKKVKPGKEQQEWPNDAGQVKEGLLDDDFGMSDDNFGLGWEKTLEDIVKMANGNSAIPEKEWVKLYDLFKIQCRELQAKTKPASMTIKKACLSKEYTIVAFLNKTSGGGSKILNTDYTYGIEIRKFIKNPRPLAVQFSYVPYCERVMWRKDYHVNHPQALNFKTSEWFALPGFVWDELRKNID